MSAAAFCGNEKAAPASATMVFDRENRLVRMDATPRRNASPHMPETRSQPRRPAVGLSGIACHVGLGILFLQPAVGADIGGGTNPQPGKG